MVILALAPITLTKGVLQRECKPGQISSQKGNPSAPQTSIASPAKTLTPPQQNKAKMVILSRFVRVILAQGPC